MRLLGGAVPETVGLRLAQGLATGQQLRRAKPANAGFGPQEFQGAKSARGSKAAEVFYSLIMTCVHLGVSPKPYLDAATPRDGNVLTPAQFQAR
jgi:hypothetical protein